MIKDGIYIKTTAATIHIPIYDKITVITGDSSTGKTKLLNFLRALKSVQKHGGKEILESTIDISTIELVSDESFAELIQQQNIENKIIFIDRMNVFLSPQLISFIRSSNNLFILMGHRNISELTSQDAVLGLKHDGINYECYQIYKNGILNPTDKI